jgi:hypothetical protein
MLPEYYLMTGLCQRGIVASKAEAANGVQNTRRAKAKTASGGLGRRSCSAFPKGGNGGGRIRDVRPWTQRAIQSPAPHCRGERVWLRGAVRNRPPATLGKREIEQFLTHLAIVRKVSASTQNQALAAILFLYKHVLHRDLDWPDDVVRAK